jgi:glycerophosphoryl diester phosphodiesterase
MAHRGDMANAPENTVAGFRLAIEARTDLLETDLWFTRDGHLVCHHDPTLDRMTGDPRALPDVSLDELKALRIKAGTTAYTDEQVPTLDELLALTPPDVVLVLELKDPAFEFLDACRALADRIEDRLASNTVIMVSFHLERLHAMRRVDPRARIGFITPLNPLPVQDVDMIGPYFPVVLMNPFFVQMAHARGKWTCVLDNRLHDHLAAYQRMGFDCVLSDDPAETRRLLEASHHHR